MKQRFLEVLSYFDLPIFLQGTLAEDEAYPDTFLTFWTDSVDDASHYDNDVASWDWSFSLMLYSNNPAIVNELPAEIRSRLKAAGFIPQGKGMDIRSDEPTHTGWAMDFICREQN